MRGNIDFPTPFCKEDKGKVNHYPWPKSGAKLMGYHFCRELIAVAWGSLLAGDEYNPFHHGRSYLGLKKKKKKYVKVSLVGQSQSMTLLNLGCRASPNACGRPVGPGGFKSFLSQKLPV